MPVQVPKIEIHDESARIVKGWGTVDIFDKANERLPIEEFKRIMPVLMDRGGLIMNRHTNQPVGKILNYVFKMKDTQEGPKEGVYLTTKVFKDFGSDDDVWEAIKKEEIEGFSFGGRNNKEELDFSKGVSRKTLKGLESFEFSYVPKGMNQESTIEEINYIAKEDTEEGETSNDSGHYHLYKIDSSGEGKTLGTLPREAEDHVHEIKSGVVQVENSHDHRLIRMLVNKEIKKVSDFSEEMQTFEEDEYLEIKIIAKDAYNSIPRLIETIGQFAGPGHSTNIVVEPNSKDNQKFNFDGDGPDRIESISAKKINIKDIDKNYEKNKESEKEENSDDETLSKNDSTLNDDAKVERSFINNISYNKNMTGENTKKVEEVPQANSEPVQTEDPAVAMNSKLDQIISLLSGVQKAEEEDKDEDKKEDDKDEDKDVEKEGDGEKVKLPESEGDEVSQDKPAEGGKGDESAANFLQKQRDEIKAEVKKEIMKELTNNKANTPRPEAKANNNIQKADIQKTANNWAEANKMARDAGKR